MKSIVSKIFFIFIVLALFLGIVIFVSELISSTNKKDSLVINIVGKERMITQKIAKELFLLHITNSSDFTVLDLSIQEFEENINNLINGNSLKGIYQPPTQEIFQNLIKIKNKWIPFIETINTFKIDHQSQNQLNIINLLKDIDLKSTDLLLSIDEIVKEYSEHSRENHQKIEQFQFLFGIIMIGFIFYIILVIKGIKDHFEQFISKSKILANIQLNDKTQQLDKTVFNFTGDNEELFIAQKNLESFVDKVNSVITNSSQAKQLSQDIAKDLVTISETLEENLNKLNLSVDEREKLEEKLNQTEDIAIESSEELMQTVKLFEKLKTNLDLLISKYEKN